MKNVSILLMVALLFLSGTGQAVWTKQADMDPADIPDWLDTSGTLHKASNLLGLMPITVGGVPFDKDKSNLSTNWGKWKLGLRVYAGSSAPFPVQVLCDLQGKCWGWQQGYVDFTGLEVGREYRFQALVGQPWGWGANGIYAPDGTRTDMRDGVPGKSIKGATKVFTAETPDVTFKFARWKKPKATELMAYSLYKMPLRVEVDLKPAGCPNAVNIDSQGVTPLAIVGSADLDIATIDIASLALEGIAPTSFEVIDSTQPAGGDLCACTDAGPDGILDLEVRFPTAEIAALLEGAVSGDEYALNLTGKLLDGEDIVGSDCVLIKARPAKKVK